MVNGINGKTRNAIYLYEVRQYIRNRSLDCMIRVRSFVYTVYGSKSIITITNYCTNLTFNNAAKPNILLSMLKLLYSFTWIKK